MELSRPAFIDTLLAKGWKIDNLCSALVWAESGDETYMVDPSGLYYSVVTNSETLLDGEHKVASDNVGTHRATLHFRAGKLHGNLPAWVSAGDQS